MSEELANQSQEEEVFENNDFGLGEGTPPEAMTEGEPPESQAAEELFFEVTYNKEPVKIKHTEAPLYIQKGLNYDKVHGRLTEYERKVQLLQELTGYDIDANIEYLQNQILEEQAKASGVNPEILKRQQATEAELQYLKQRDFLRDVQSRNIQQKAELRDKPFFAELEAEIDARTMNNPNVDVEAVYTYLMGKRAPELIEKARKEAEQKVMNDLKLKQKGRVQPGSANTVTPKPQFGSLREALSAAAGEIEDW